ncbi:uncharacterized protein LOC133737671 [Rosa rugosa]|uniref:uncharacterized protein LOC133737671 n=1 Tax=Rosa rugosa TaxID=74645 RepID=UPI002B4123EF|nr:uncharacterized protein LOC133737671 [Rosa rugosa]
MDIWYGRPTSAVCCEKAVFAGISNRHRDGSLPHMRTLRLHGMEKLMRLWDTQPAGQQFPKLEILEVKFCGLNNLELSSLPFQNLTSLEVTFCWRLQYLTTYSVAGSAKQLKKLKVDECKSMKQILASEGIGEDDSNCEILFEQLQHLELSDLVDLERFCSNNCTVKVPKLGTLEVNWCSIKLKVSSGILEVDSNMHLDVQKSHSSKQAFNTTESASASSSEKSQKHLATNASEGAEHIEFSAQELHDDSLTDELNKHGPLLPAGITKSEHGVEGVIQETPINFQNMEHHEVMGLNLKQIVTNTSKKIQEADFGMQETLIEPLNAKEACRSLMQTSDVWRKN